ncbi:MAG TPA: flagellar hook-basal body protein [Lachnospiraceae bacterium]|nr:flagellar hook-basal body protein [Lachnospiraceae bacterium]
MRVTNASTYRNYTSQVNTVHANLNKSLNKISSGKAYESAAESPLSYYRGKEIDNQYMEILSKDKLITDVKNRLYQQELGVRDIHSTLVNDVQKAVLRARNATTTDYADATIRDALLQYEHTMVNDLNAQYQDFYVYGGNDISTPPFELSSDGKTLTYNHTFPGDTTPKTFVMDLTRQTDGSYAFEFNTGASSGTEKDLIRAMSEQGRMDLGYGDIRDRDTLLDTYTGGMNVLTGITSDSMVASQATGSQITIDMDYIMEKLTDGPLGLTAKAVWEVNDFLNGEDSDMFDQLGTILAKIPDTGHTTSTFYSDLGNKYNLLENLDLKLNDLQDSLTEQYKDILGADPYESVLEMYNNQYAYNAALQVGSKLMNNSLFDFVR